MSTDCYQNELPYHFMQESYIKYSNISDGISPCESSSPSAGCHVSQHSLFVFQGSFQQLRHSIAQHPEQQSDRLCSVEIYHQACSTPLPLNTCLRVISQTGHSGYCGEHSARYGSFGISTAPSLHLCDSSQGHWHSRSCHTQAVVRTGAWLSNNSL